MWGKWEMGEGSLFRNEDCHILFRSSHWRCSVKKMFLEILQNSQENTCTRVSFLMERRLWHRYFSVNFAKFSNNIFFSEHLWSTAFIYWGFSGDSSWCENGFIKTCTCKGVEARGNQAGPGPPTFWLLNFFIVNYNKKKLKNLQF